MLKALSRKLSSGSTRGISPCLKSMSVTEFAIPATAIPTVANAVAGPMACSTPARAVVIPRNSDSAVSSRPSGSSRSVIGRQVAERSVYLEPERYVAKIKLLPYQRAYHKSSIRIVENRTGIAPVRKTVDINDPVACPSVAYEDARVSPRPIEKGAPGPLL